MSDPSTPVPNYALYGEKQALPAEDFFHCETIAVRSERHNWEIAPHVHPGLSQVLFVARGRVEAQFEGKLRALSGPVLVYVPHTVVHGFIFAQDVVGFIVTASHRFLDSLGRHDMLRRRLQEMAFEYPPPAVASGLLQIGRQLLAAEQTRFDPDGHRLHHSLAEAWLRLATRPVSGETSTGSSIPGKFLALVETSYRSHKPLGWYAQQLNCTARTLSRHTDAAFGMSPLRIINRRLEMEARRLLRASDASCSHVAAELGFEDPSYFSRFYLQMTGKRPSTERRP